VHLVVERFAVRDGRRKTLRPSHSDT